MTVVIGVPERITFRLAVLVHRYQHGLEPSYLADEFQRVADTESRQRLRSASTMALVVLSSIHSPIGDGAFPVAAAQEWPSTAGDVFAVVGSLSAAFKDRNVHSVLRLKLAFSCFAFFCY